MCRIAQVFQIELPVAFERMFERAACDLELSLGRAIGHVVEGSGHVAEKFFQARSFLGKARKDKAAVARDPRHAAHACFWVFGIEVRGIAVQERGSLQASIQMVGPAVVAAAKFRCVTFSGGNDERTAMGTLIMQQRNSSVRIANEKQRLSRNAGGKKIAGLGKLAHVSHAAPCRGDNFLKLELEYFRIRIKTAVHAAGLNKTSDFTAAQRHVCISGQAFIALVPPISSSYSGCSKLVKELEIEKR